MKSTNQKSSGQTREVEYHSQPNVISCKSRLTCGSFLGTSLAPGLLLPRVVSVIFTAHPSLPQGRQPRAGCYRDLRVPVNASSAAPAFGRPQGSCPARCLPPPGKGTRPSEQRQGFAGTPSPRGSRPGDEKCQPRPRDPWRQSPEGASGLSG